MGVAVAVIAALVASAAKAEMMMGPRQSSRPHF